MPYAPQAEYRGDQYLQSGLARADEAMQKYADAAKKAKALRTTIKLYAPQLGDIGQQTAAGVDAMSLPELEGALAGLSAYAARAADQQSMALKRKELEQQAERNAAINAYYQQQGQARQAAVDLDRERFTAERNWQEAHGMNLDAYNDPMAAVGYANRIAPGGMPSQVAGDLLQRPGAAQSAYQPRIVTMPDGTKAFMSSENSAQLVPDPAKSANLAQDRMKLSALQRRISGLQTQMANEFDGAERQKLRSQIEQISQELMTLVGLSSEEAPVEPAPSSGRKYKIEIVK